MNGRPIGNRKKVQILVIFTLMAWATQTLLHQWGFGAEVPIPPAPMAAANGRADLADGAGGLAVVSGEVAGNARTEKFVPATPRVMAGATLELRSEATVYGPEVRLRQICRWSDRDTSVFSPVADLVVMRLDGKTPFQSISLDELTTTLSDAKANLAAIRLAGPLLCTVHRSDAPVEPGNALQQWIDARTAEAPGSIPKPTAPAQAAGGTEPKRAALLTAPAAVPAAVTAVPLSGGAAPAPRVDDVSPVRSLRQLLTEDLSVRLNLPVDQLQIAFNPKDERVLALSEPMFKFNLEPTRVRDLGEVAWDVLVVHASGSQKVSVAASARAWQAQLVAARPLTARQVLRADDVTPRRTLVDRIGDEPLLTLPQLVGQQASRDIKPGTLLTSRMVDAVPYARTGQYIGVTVNQGAVQVKTAGRAMEGGSFGQTIRVKNEATGDQYEVVLTAPQEGSIGPATAAAAAPKLAAARP